MEDTIAAIATAYGEAGIGVVRISGKDALPLLEKIFKSGSREEAGEKARREDGNSVPERLMRYGHIVDPSTGHVIDESMAVYFKGPRSYTAEDVVEIYCHGSLIALKNTLAVALENGARLAEPGEFTKRAFLNGRIDLTQAEAVIDMIKARSDSGYDMAIAQLDGELSRQVGRIRKELLDLLVEMAVNIDYPEEDIEEITLKTTEKKLSLIGDMIGEILENSRTGRMIREGLRIAIAGRPNVGKSSLMNAILKENRAIVTEIPGTTRDTIEESATIRDIPVVLVDTAGIHDTDDKVEILGIERSRRAFQDADFIILVIDGSRNLSDEDVKLLRERIEKPTLVVINKSDLENVVSEEDVKAHHPSCRIVHTSMKDGKGLGEIEDIIEEMVYGGRIRQKEAFFVSNVRHIQLLRQAREDVLRGKAMAAAKQPLDIIEVDARSAYDDLGEIIGETVSDDVLKEVFSRFCLGK